MSDPSPGAAPAPGAARVLLLTQVLPFPPDSGPKVKSWHVLERLSRQHRVTLVSFVRDDPPAARLRLEATCEEVHTVPIGRPRWREGVALLRSLAGGRPFLMARDERLAMHRLLVRLAAEGPWDLVHADQLNMAVYAWRFPARARLLDCHNALWLLYRRLARTLPHGPRRWLLERDWRLLRSYHRQIAPAFDTLLAVSREDADALRVAAGGAGPSPQVVPIAIDTRSYETRRPKGGERHLLHLGTMFWPPNVDAVRWFATEALPRVRRRHPDVLFEVVGARPPRSLRRLEEKTPGMRVHGYQEELSPFLERAALLVVPLRAGSGMRVKILEAMARGIPVVSTPLGAEGIEARPGEEILLGDDAEALARAAVRLLDDPEEGARVGAAGRRLVESRYDVRVVGPRLDAVYQATLRRVGAPLR